MDGAPPFIPDYTLQPQWRWQWWKFDLDPETLFKELADKYNTAPCRIQGHEAFHADVSSIILEAEDVDDFHRRLEARREDRLREIQGAWYSGNAIVNYEPGAWSGNPRLWQSFLQLASNLSFDAIVRFIDAHIPDGSRNNNPRMGLVNPAPPAPPTVSPAEGDHRPNPGRRMERRQQQQEQQQRELQKREPQQQKQQQQAKAATPQSTPRRRKLQRSASAGALTKDAGVGRGRRPLPRQQQQKDENDKKPSRKSLGRTRTSRRIAGLLPELELDMLPRKKG